MKYITILLVLAFFVAGCGSNSSDSYATPNQPQPQQSAVGGGCGVIPQNSNPDSSQIIYVPSSL